MEGKLVVRKASAEELGRWDELIGRFPGNRLFHTASWVRSLGASTRAKPLFLVAEKDGDVVGCVPGLLSTVGPVRIFGSPREGWQTESMGPIFDPDRVSTLELCTVMVRFLERRYHVHHIEMASTELDSDEMRALGFRGQPVFTYRVPLYPDDPERVLKRTRHDVRKNLKKAARNRLVARTETDEKFVDECYDQMRDVFARHGAAVPYSRNRLLQCFQHMKASGNLLALSVRTATGTCVATGIFLIGGGELILWAWTHLFEARPLCPTELMTWTAMQRGMDARCATFDMTGGGSTKPRYGAVPDERTYRWMRSRYPWLSTLRNWAKRGHHWQQSVRGRVRHRLHPPVALEVPVGSTAGSGSEAAE